LLGCPEIDVARAAAGVVEVEHHPHRVLARQRGRDGGMDALAGHLGDLLVHDLRLRGAAAALQVVTSREAR
jgi:hypothetical protein